MEPKIGVPPWLYSADLFGRPMRLTEEQITRLANAGTIPPETHQWSTQIGIERTNELMGLAIRRGVAEDATAALVLAGKVHREKPIGKPPYDTAALHGRTNRDYLRRVSRRAAEGTDSSLLVPGSNGSFLDRHFGTLTHQAILPLMADIIPPSPPGINTQEPSRQLALPPIKDQSEVEEVLVEPIGAACQIRGLLEEMAPLVAQNGTMSMQEQNRTRALAGRLCGSLVPFVGERNTAALMALSQRHHDFYLGPLTAMIWGRSWLQFSGQPGHPTLPEVRVLDPSKDPDLYVTGGRMDGVSLIVVNGREPTAAEVQFFGEAGRSAGELGLTIRQCEQAIGRAEIEIIVEIKSAVGDAPKNRNGSKEGVQGRVITLAHLEGEPLAEHVDQCRRYLTLGTWGYDRFDLKGDGRGWVPSGRFSQARLVYLMPSGPCTYLVRMTPAEERDFFEEYLAPNIRRGLPEAVLRAMTQSAVHAFTDRPGKVHVVKQSGRVGMGEMMEDSQPRPSLFKAAQERRRFVDWSGCVEELTNRRTGRLWRILYSGELDKLYRSGDWKFVGFNPKRGGMVACLNPDHQDSNPSMSVRIDKGMFHCFRCGFSGKVVNGSANGGIGIMAPPSGKFLRENAATLRTVIDNEFKQFMQDTQELLRRAFWDSPAERYLVGRGLNPQLAFAHQAGFGDDRGLVGGLLEKYSYEQLLHYGILKCREGLSSGPLMRVLKERGLRPEDMRRRIYNRNGAEVDGWPVSVLGGRITFPLTIGEYITNFYGRATWTGDKKFAHRKLSTEHTGIPQGGFNMGALQYGEEFGEMVAATEGIMDALSLMQMGYGVTLAVVGLANRAVFEEIAGRSVRLAIALDYDPSGMAATQKFIDKLRAAGFKGEVTDFTLKFLADHPELRVDRVAKDFNGWLQQLPEFVYRV